MTRHNTLSIELIKPTQLAWLISEAGVGHYEFVINPMVEMTKYDLFHILFPFTEEIVWNIFLDL